MNSKIFKSVCNIDEELRNSSELDEHDIDIETNGDYEFMID